MTMSPQTIKVIRVLGEGCPCRMFYALVNRQYAQVSAAAQPSVVVERLHASDGGDVAVGCQPNAVDEVGSGYMQMRLRNGFASVLQQVAGLFAQQALYIGLTHGVFW